MSRFSFVYYSTENVRNLMIFFNPFPNNLILRDFCLHDIQYIRYNSFVQSYHLQLKLINNILILNFIVIFIIIIYIYYLVIR